MIPCVKMQQFNRDATMGIIAQIKCGLTTDDGRPEYAIAGCIIARIKKPLTCMPIEIRKNNRSR